MSQKYKNFAKGYGQVIDSNVILPSDVKRVGYLRKLKKMKRRFFVLRLESESGAARLEYYSSEKKWRSGSMPRRCIELKSCLNISRKLHSKQKNVIALYTQDDCFAVVTENSEELDLWLNDILEVQKSYIAADENMRGRPVYEHLWQVVIDKHDLECAQNLTGPYRVALSSKALTLIKMNASDECDYLEFPLMSIRRCGHSKDHFFIELGRSAITGAGEIYMATEATIIAQNMHETVLSAMKSSKIREDGNSLPRPRSASTSENTNPVATRRPIGIVAPQSASVVSNSMLSNSRERCDSLPTRPKTLSENSHSCVLSAVSSPYTSSGISCRRLNSRPHSMYEWPSFNSPSARNTSFSPCSLSSAAGYNSSTEEMDCLKLQSSSYLTLKSADGILSSDRPITEVPDEYLSMTPSEVCSVKKLDGYIPMAPGGVSEDLPVVIQEGYLVMSPTDIFPKQVNNNANSVELEEENKAVMNQNLSKKDEHNEIFKLEKVPSMLIVAEENKENAANAALKNNLSNGSKGQNECKQAWISRSTQSCKSQNTNIPFPENKQIDSTNDENLSASKPPIPERSYRKPEFRSNIGPPLPLRKHECSENSSTENEGNTANSGKVLKYNQNEVKRGLPEMEINLSDCIQIEENSVLGELETFSKNKIAKKLGVTNKISPDQNTNFSCLVHNEKNSNNFFRCASLCSANKAPYNGQKIDTVRSEQIHPPQSVNKFSCSKKPFDSIDPSIQNNSNALNIKEFSTNFPLPNSSCKTMNSDNCLVTDQDSLTCNHGDYVNLEFKKSSNVNASPSATGNFINKTNLQMSLHASCSADPNYTNIHFGKPYCPPPNPIPATCESKVSSFHNSARQDKTKSEQSFLPSQNVSVSSNLDSIRGQIVQHSPTCTVNCAVETQKSTVLTPKFRNIPNTLPAFRKQMSAPAAPSSLRPELPSPGRKSSCPVTASASMIRPSLPVTSVNFMRPALLQSHVTTAHLRVSTSRSPDHSSVSSISSASDEISSNHSSPKILTASQNFSTSNRQALPDCQYENIVIPQRPSTSSRPPSVSSEKELNYASLDLTPSVREDIPRSPIIQKPSNSENVETLLYAEIDFTKSEGLKSVSGTVRDSRL